MRSRCIFAIMLAACGDPEMLAPDSATDGDAAVDLSWVREDAVASVTALAGTPRSTTTERDAARAYLLQRLGELGWAATTHAYGTGANVVATIPATTGSTRRILVGAHFDSAAGSPGANDNASGVAVVLAVARRLRDVPVRDAETAIVLFDEEELGLVGSRAYAAMLADGDLATAYTIDQVSWDGDGDRTFEIEKPTAALEAAYRAAASVVGVSISVTATEGTDHQAFRERGIAAVGLTEEYVGGDTSPHVHRPTDVADTVNSEYLALAARLAMEVVERALETP